MLIKHYINNCDSEIVNRIGANTKMLVNFLRMNIIFLYLTSADILFLCYNYKRTETEMIHIVKS